VNNILLRNIETHIKELKSLIYDIPIIEGKGLVYFDHCLHSLSLLETIMSTENYPSDWEEGKNI
jgi:hypothetical protein